jgi:hypothetical protein
MLLAKLAFLLTFAATPASASAACDTNARALALAPAALPATLSADSSNGIETTLTLSLDASGHVLAVTGDWQAPLRSALATWAKRGTFAPAMKHCKPVASTLEMDNVDFFPASSGVAGSSKVVGGVDFANLKYTNGPGNCTTARMHDGSAADTTGEYTAEIQDLFTGIVSGRTVAIIILRCEYNGHGFDSQAQLFEVSSGKPKRLGILGEGGMASSDSPFPPWPGGWIHVSFINGRLYADVWDTSHRCDSHRDWISSTYTIRDERLALLNKQSHHRKGIPPACDS